jgi:hypothetical protein
MTEDIKPSPADGVTVPLTELRARRAELISRRARRQRTLYMQATIAVLVPIALAALFLRNKSWFSSAFAPVIFLYAMAPFAMVPMTRVRVRQIEEEIQDLDFEIDLRQFSVTPQESHAEKILRISNTQLRRYYDLNLNQNIWIFGLGVFCILLGVAVIGTTLFLLLWVAQETETKIITGAVGAIGSLLVNYVAAIYLKMNAEAASNLSTFHSRLVETHQMLLANLLASRIEDETKRWDTISQLSINVAKK